MWKGSDFKPPPRAPKAKKFIRRTAIKKRYKNTGQAIVFKQIAVERPHRCVRCGKEIKELVAGNFAHLLSKKSFPRFMLYKKNIQIMCFNIEGTGCHNLYDNEAESVLERQDPVGWVHIFDLKQKLKEEYHGKN